MKCLMCGIVIGIKCRKRDRMKNTIGNPTPNITATQHHVLALFDAVSAPVMSPEATNEFARAA